MTPATKRVLRAVSSENCGPRKRNVLDAIATSAGEGPYLIDYLIASGKLVKFGERRGATWGLPTKR